MSWRFIATRLNGDGTERFLHWNLPITGPEVYTALSGPDSVDGEISPEYADLKTEKGEPIFVPWQTAIYAEEDGVIRGGAILVRTVETGPQFSLETVGFSGYAKDIPYESSYTGYEVDALDVTRRIWDFIQAQADGNIGLELDRATMSGYKMGKREDPNLTKAKAAEKDAEATAKAKKTAYDKAKAAADAAKIKVFRAAGISKNDGRIIEQDSKPSGGSADRKNVWIDKNDKRKVYTYNGKDWKEKSAAVSQAVRDAVSVWQTADGKIKPAKDAWDDAKEKHKKAKEQREKIKGGEADPYLLSWWEMFDLGGEIDELADAAPFDYRVIHEWSGERIRHRMVFGAPTLGRRHHRLRFVVGENIFEIPALESDGDDYADEIIVLGAGEGKKMVRGNARNAKTGRLHRAKVIEDKTVKTKAKADKLAGQILKRYSGAPEITSVVVEDHPHAPLGSFDVGDEILVETADGWSNDRAIWCRILGKTYEPESDRTTVELIRVEKVN